MADKKVAVITGAAQGIGAATARLFAARDYATVAVDILVKEGRQLAEQCRAQGGECDFCLCDVASETQVQHCIEQVMERYGGVDVLVNNAGIVLVKPLEETAFAEYRRTFDVNVGGTFLMTKYVLPVMKRQRRGAIVNMASVSGHVGQIDHVMYGATKGAILALTRALAWEVAA
jgi:NAD(P)-dependent dehydrogenase (short-subunit alcohol dehydrogenase family)